MRLNFALFDAIFTAKLAKSAKLGRLLIMCSCAAKGFRICVYLRNLRFHISETVY